MVGDDLTSVSCHVPPLARSNLFRFLLTHFFGWSSHFRIVFQVLLGIFYVVGRYGFRNTFAAQFAKTYSEPFQEGKYVRKRINSFGSEGIDAMLVALIELLDPLTSRDPMILFKKNYCTLIRVGSLCARSVDRLLMCTPGPIT